MGFFQNFYYGKAGQADFNPEDLPKNRVELFFAMLRIRFSSLITQNLMYVVFCIPTIILCAYAFQFLNAVAAAMVEQTEEAAALAANFSRDQFSLMCMFFAAMIPCLGLAGVGATGMTYVIRNWTRDQHAFSFSDFKDSIKTNWKQGLAFGLLSGLINLVCYVGWTFYGQQAAAAGSTVMAMLFSVLQGLMLVVVIVWWMMNMVAFPMMVTYEMKLRVVLRNSLIMTVAKLPMSLGIWLLSLLPTILCGGLFMIIGSGYELLAWVLIYLLIGFSFNCFLYASYANSLFDKYMNPRIEGAPINMGLRSPEYDDLEDDDESASTDNPYPQEKTSSYPGAAVEPYPPTNAYPQSLPKNDKPESDSAK